VALGQIGFSVSVGLERMAQHVLVHMPVLAVQTATLTLTQPKFNLRRETRLEVGRVNPLETHADG